jgi:hypothetical protein
VRRALAILVLTGGVARADLGRDKDRKAAEDKLAAQLKDTNDTCGTTLAAAYDWASETKDPPKQAGLGPSSCSEVLRGIASKCSDGAEAMKAVQTKVKTVACKYNAGVTKKKSKGHGLATDLAGEPAVPHTWLELVKGTLKVELDWMHANTKDEVAKYLQHEL